ncbi:DoxX family protein [Sphingobacterium sp. lm-10]|uniref:DoxX family protein n=1 Tax=Sphingobacterium sp. lm-10 TaxID=2944904 RepID=UPI0020207274|nr:DoxX family protein [Sphingobacterium sp. lm-10]MCL7987304.1 DoxX family protein [Sphingobacterium sp. lm-10]
MNSKNYHVGLLVLRLNFGILMLFHGVHKLLNGVHHVQDMLSEIGLPSFLAYGVHIGETIAPILLIIGFRTKIAASAFTLVMLVAFAMAHTENFFELGKAGAWQHELVALYLFGGLGLFFTGGGKYALSSTNKWD